MDSENYQDHRLLVPIFLDLREISPDSAVFCDGIERPISNNCLQRICRQRGKYYEVSSTFIPYPTLFSETAQIFLIGPSHRVWDTKVSVFVPWKEHIGYQMLQKLGETLAGYLNICSRKLSLEEVFRAISKFKCM